MAARENRVVDGHTLALTNLDKVIYPITGTTKGEVIDYYQAIAPLLIPHLRGRPVTRKRWPNGVDTEPFFEKRLPLHAPEWIARGSQFHADGESIYPIVDSPATLVWLGQQAALELHVPQWTFVAADGDPTLRPGPPNRLVIDLDPGPGTGLTECARLALRVRELLTGMGMDSVPVTSGSKGLHVYARLPRALSGRGTATIAKAVATQLEIEFPGLVTAAMSKSAREGKVMLDWSQNHERKTTISPYSLRGRTHPTVAAPRAWSELDDPALAQLSFTEVRERANQQGDLLAGLLPPEPPPSSIAPPDARPATIAVLSERRRAKQVAEGVAVPSIPAAMLPTESSIDGLSGLDWAFERKWDGYRALIGVAGSTDREAGVVSLRSRSGRDVTAEYPEFSALAVDLAGHSAVLDGEIVVLDPDGNADFAAMASSSGVRTLVLFDLLGLDGVDLCDRPFAQRRRLLESLAPLLDPSGPVRVPELVEATDGAQAVRISAADGIEGIVAKRLSSTYVPGTRSSSWLKHKNWHDQQVVIGGWRPRRDGNLRVGALLLGVIVTGPDGGPLLRYCGAVGTGFTERELVDLTAELAPLARKSSPFAPRWPIESSRWSRAEEPITWVRPALVADVRYAAVSPGGQLRHPSWRGIRRDLLPGDLERMDHPPFGNQ